MARGQSINNILMASVAIPLVVCWLVFASPAGTMNTNARLCSGLLDWSMIQSIN